MNIEQACVENHSEWTGGYRILTIRSPKVARAVKPGQFIHVLVPRLDSAVLRRPFSVFGATRDLVTVLYKQVGKGTRALAAVSPGDEVSVLGPLGNGFPPVPAGRVPVFIAGGYGVAPLYFLPSRIRRKGVFLIGGASAKDILCVDAIRKLTWEVRVATVDGSLGRKGLVTDILDIWFNTKPAGVKPEVYACGPDGMLKAVGARAIGRGCRAWLSLDKHMGCGVGACLACVQRIRKPDGEEALVRVCREGPVFEARSVVWG